MIAEGWCQNTLVPLGAKLLRHHPSSYHGQSVSRNSIISQNWCKNYKIENVDLRPLVHKSLYAACTSPKNTCKYTCKNTLIINEHVTIECYWWSNYKFLLSTHLAEQEIISNQLNVENAFFIRLWERNKSDQLSTGKWVCFNSLNQNNVTENKNKLRQVRHLQCIFLIIWALKAICGYSCIHQNKITGLVWHYSTQHKHVFETKNMLTQAHTYIHKNKACM